MDFNKIGVKFKPFFFRNRFIRFNFIDIIFIAWIFVLVSFFFVLYRKTINKSYNNCPVRFCSYNTKKKLTRTNDPGYKYYVNEVKPDEPIPKKKWLKLYSDFIKIHDRLDIFILSII